MGGGGGELKQGGLGACSHIYFAFPKPQIQILS